MNLECNGHNRRGGQWYSCSRVIAIACGNGALAFFVILPLRLRHSSMSFHRRSILLICACFLSFHSFFFTRCASACSTRQPIVCYPCKRCLQSKTN
ncbi:MAG: hypothetical protein J3R72DRAFT_444700 [Linnemannia gamsii]|nr:MAG: hypothetical protein J3R72DRAFT_444700 [Linnemannia gamsii]